MFQLRLGDSRQLIKTIPDKSVDLIFTDFPYNIAPYVAGTIKVNGRKNVNEGIAENALWDNNIICPEEWSKDFVRILKPTGNIALFIGFNQAGDFHKTFDPLFRTYTMGVWHKTNPTPQFRKVSFCNSIEFMAFMWNSPHTWNWLGQNEMHNHFEGAICMGNERVKNSEGQTLHPTQKPLWLLKKIISIASNPNDAVFDPFMGVGSTGVAALQLGRNFIGFEKEQKYFDAACQRIASQRVRELEVNHEECS